MSWAVSASVGMGLLGASEQRKANSQARDAADKSNRENNALRDQAMPYALENLKTNANLQKFYQNNPFNQQQKTGYQNQNNLIDGFNGTVAPGLLNFANGMMGQSYSRQRGGAPGSAGGYGGPIQAAGMQPNTAQSGGLLGGGPFVPPGYQSFGQIDFDKMNPFSAQNKTPENTASNPTYDPSMVTQNNFNEADYFAANPDILASGWDRGGWDHWTRAGKGEGRSLKKGG